MIKHGAIIGLGTVLLVFGLGGLALLQSGVIYPRPLIGPVPFSEVKPPDPAPRVAQAPPPRAAESAPAYQAGLGQASRTSKDLAPQKTVPVAPQLGQNEPRDPGQGKPEQQLSLPEEPGTLEERTDSARAAEPESDPGQTGLNDTESGMQPVVIRFRLDPAHDREIYIARVHWGDRIRVKVRRVGPVERRVYFTYTRGIDSKQGALVKAVTASTAAGFYPYARGYYVIEMRIYPGNRWNIKPRSFV